MHVSAIISKINFSLDIHRVKKYTENSALGYGFKLFADTYSSHSQVLTYGGVQ